MKKLIYISFILLALSCKVQKEVTYYECPPMVECFPIPVTFNTKIEAKIVAKRTENNCTKPDRRGSTVYFYKDQIECSKNGRGFIREIYEPQIINYIYR